MRLEPGTPAPRFCRQDHLGQTVDLDHYQGRRVYVSFHRFAACPLCNIRVHRLIAEHEGWQKAGLHVIAFFQSPPDVIQQAVGRQHAPFPIVGDPSKEVYSLYAVERSMLASLKAARRLPDAITSAAKGLTSRHFDGDPHLVPASFLVDEAGIVRHAYYGSDGGDHMPLETIHRFARGENVAHS